MTDNAPNLGLDMVTKRYKERISSALADTDWDAVTLLATDLQRCWRLGQKLLVCGNGGSGANAIHIENDLLYGISKKLGSGIACKVLTANSSVITCLANDEGYEKIFSYQVAVHAKEGDVLLILSGSGNSQNILYAIEEAKKHNIKTFGFVGFDGGKAKKMLDVAIHTPIFDMQISEDIQMMIMHMISQWLFEVGAE